MGRDVEEALKAQIETIKTVSGLAGAVGVLAERVSQLETVIKSLSDRLAALEKKLDD